MEILLFILMSIRPYIQGQAIDLGNRPSGCNIRFECDTEAELPTGENAIDGDTAYAEDTNKIFRRQAGAWVEKASFAAGTIPAGLIAMWHGTLANIPAGWIICDGQNGTPDLRDKFVKGAAGGQNPGDVGGSATHTHADHPALSHSGAAVADHASHTHQYTEVPNHVHPISDPGHVHLTQRYPTTSGGSSGFTADTSMSGTPADNTLATKSAMTGITGTDNPTGGVVSGTTQGPSAALSHAVTQPADHAAQVHQTVNSEPPYYTVAYIMKT